MDLNSAAATLLLSSVTNVSMESVDTDDECDSADEEIVAALHFAKEQKMKRKMSSERAESGSSMSSESYHKMTVIQDRAYQTELLEMAKSRNIIICLPTGSGKTYIALKLAEHMLPQAIEKKQKIVFLANNVPLVNQQAKYFSANLACTYLNDDKLVRPLTGDLNVDIWKQDQWNEVLASCHILVASTQIVLDALTKAYIKWNDIALLILDECHHAQKLHPMAVLMQKYGERLATSGPSELPRVLGLTATIIKGQSTTLQIQQDIEDIEKLLCCKAVTHRNYEEVLRFSTSTKLIIRSYEPQSFCTDEVSSDITELIGLLGGLPKDYGVAEERSIVERIDHPTLSSESQIYNRDKGVPKTLKSFIDDLVKTYQELGPYCAKMAAIYKAIYLVKWIQEIDGGDDHFDNQWENELVDNDRSVLLLLEDCKTRIFQLIHKLDLKMNRAAKEGVKGAPNITMEAWKLRNCVSQKIKLLWELLENRKPNGQSIDERENELCGLIFTERRITAQVLRWYLEESAKHWPECLGFLKPDVMVGHSTAVADTQLSRFTAKLQEKIVRNFHKKKINLLVATQVVEEGLDVPACNLVVRFDCINSYPSFVQSLGRARQPGATCYALIDSSKQQKEELKIRGFLQYNQKLAEVLEENAVHVGDLAETDSADNEASKNSKLIPPFNPSGDPNGPEITATDAISLVHRYCMMLSCDKIASLVPTAWKQEKFEKKKYFKAWVVLPIMSGVTDAVEGDWMPDKSTAKRSAFLNCCRKLYEMGELTKNLLPRSRRIDDFACEFLDNLTAQFVDENDSAVGKIGSRKRTQLYRKKIPQSLSAGNSETETDSRAPFLMYRIDIKLKTFIGPDNTDSIYDFDKHGLYYGILSSHDLSAMPTIQLKANFGTLAASLKKCTTPASPLSTQEIDTLKHFQVYMRDSIYNIRASVAKLEMNPALLVVPIRRKGITDTYELDWDLVEKLSHLDEDNNLYNIPADITRETMEFRKENYKNALLIPWYKEEMKDPSELLVAIEVSDTLNALSEFDDVSKAKTYKEYYETKYALNEIYNPHYPMLCCKNVAKQLNFLSSKVDNYEMRKSMRHRPLVKVIPELVTVHILPASLYLQGRFLPSILHRLSRLFVAFEFKMKVADYHRWDAHRHVLIEDLEDCGNGTELIKAVGADEPKSACGMESSQLSNDALASRTLERKRNFVLIETMNPLTLQWPIVNESFEGRNVKRSGFRDKDYALPEPPTLAYGALQLVQLEDVKSYNFDRTANFEVEAGPSILTVMEAFTLSNAQDNVSLEKLEVMGDSALKLVCSLHVFRNFPRWDEGKMTEMRMKLISNLHLYQLGKKHNIGEILSSSIFVPGESWLPVGFYVPPLVEDVSLTQGLSYQDLECLPECVLNDQKLLNDFVDDLHKTAESRKKPKVTSHATFTHSKINDKSVADCMEAIIGAYYMNGGIDGAFRIMDYLGFRAPLEDGSVTLFSRDSTMRPLDSPRSAERSKPQKFVPFLKDLEEVLSYAFRDPWLAVEALTHPTFVTNRITPSYERLEFQGDAIIDFLMTNYIVHETGLSDPGEITDLRAALVNNVTFGSLTVRYGFHKFLKYDHEQLLGYITQFERYQEENNHKVGNPYRLSSDHDCLTVREIEVPKVLGDVFESIIGAIFVDSGMSLDTTWAVLFRLMKNELEQFSKNIPKSPLRELYEQFPGKVKFVKPPVSKEEENLSKYRTVLLKVPCCDYVVRGQGATTKQAKAAAAKYVIRKFKYDKE